MNADIGNMLQEAAILMVVGMGVVFLFLVLLIAVMHINAKLFAPSKTVVQAVDHSVTAKNVNDPNLVAAISAAIHQYRKDKFHG